MQEKRPTNGADGTNLVAPLPVITGIVRLAVCVMDGAAASRSIAKKIQSVTPLSVYACTIRRRFQQSGIPEKRPLLRLPWMETTGICTANGVMNGGHGQRNEMDNSRPHVTRNVRDFFLAHQIELLPLTIFPDQSQIEYVRPMLAEQLIRDTPPIGTPYQLWQYEEATWTTVLQGYIQALLNLCRYMQQHTLAASLTTDFVIILKSEEVVILIV
ncbi:hypothetical protein TNCV_1082701 [Trichonephila clavipes]|nr:hypothetical protein TNCV_1082701 [Trichonephila clavipes]